MKLVFVHGWSVTNTSTYAGLPAALAKACAETGFDLSIEHIHLGRYISFNDAVTLDDISRAFDRALRDLPHNDSDTLGEFSCVTHSTGGPVVRNWVDRFYGAGKLSTLPLKHLVMLAPANHGSTLAKLGKARVGRIKAWFAGVEPGQRVLDWLQLGSDGQWVVNEHHLDYACAANGFFPFVLTGQGIDRAFYDFLNNYLVESGSDGVVRVAGANATYRYLRLAQDTQTVVRNRPLTHELRVSGGVRMPEPVPLGVYASFSHSGKKMGIMGSVEPEDSDHIVVQDLLRCLRVETAGEYATRRSQLADFTAQQQAGEDTYAMLVFSVRDDAGNQIGKDDYDLFLLAGNRYRPDDLPKGFFKDKQMNDTSGRLVYYVNASRMRDIKDGKLGIRVVARPTDGFSYYRAGEFRGDGIAVHDMVVPNQTTYIDIELHRFLDTNIFRFGSATEGPINFKSTRPSGDEV